MYLIENKDCLEALKRMDSDAFDLALIDPPYFNYVTGYRKDKTSKLSQPLIQQSREDQIEVVRECIRVLKNGKAFFFFSNWQEAWWFQEKFHTYLRNEIVWNKGNWAAGDLEGSFGCMWEAIFMGYKGKGWTYSGKRLNDVDDWVIPRVGTDRLHPTEKPVELYKKIIEIATESGDLILDPYGGSGASAIAAMETGRNILVYELDEDYYNVILRRIADWQNTHTSNK
jgi:site-specific DNA-methyltransferase (adenine-specific)